MANSVRQLDSPFEWEVMLVLRLGLNLFIMLEQLPTWSLVSTIPLHHPYRHSWNAVITKQSTVFSLKTRISISKEKYIFRKDSNRQSFNSLGGIAGMSHLDNPKGRHILASKKIQCLQEPKGYIPVVNSLYVSVIVSSPQLQP